MIEDRLHQPAREHPEHLCGECLERAWGGADLCEACERRPVEHGLVVALVFSKIGPDETDNTMSYRAPKAGNSPFLRVCDDCWGRLAGAVAWREEPDGEDADEEDLDEEDPE